MFSNKYPSILLTIGNIEYRQSNDAFKKNYKVMDNIKKM